MKILLLSRYGQLGASSRIRFYQYIPYLENNGAEIFVLPLLNDAYLRRIYAGLGKSATNLFLSYLHRFFWLIKINRAAEYDLLWIEKELFPYLPAWGESLLNSCNAPSIVDYDDSIFHNYDHHRSTLIRAVLGDKIDRVMRGADLVTAGNEYLAARARKAGARRVELLPSVVDSDRYTEVHFPERAVFTIGWIGTPHTAKFLRQIQGPLAKVCRDGRSRLLLVGSGKIELEGIMPHISPWAEVTEVESIQSFDVGIMPMPDTAWTRGKCAFKLIQYMACGRPVVASPVGANTQVVEHGVNGFLAATDDEWIRFLTLLRGDSALRTTLGQAARAKVVADYSLQVNAPRLLELMRSLVRVPPPSPGNIK